MIKNRVHRLQRAFPKNKLNLVASGVAIALGVFAGGLHAQTNTTGNVYGTVSQKSGVTVLVENVLTGFKRTLTPDAQGRYQITGLPTGNYRVSLIKDGKSVETTDNVEVRIGQGQEVSFGQTQVVEISGRKQRLDMSSATNGITFTLKELEALPIGRNVDSIIQLAPNTTRADPRFAGVSMGGGGASENAYYINGFPVTNPLNQMGFSQLPFGAISQAQVLTGGFGAEFGRSVGGVVNVTTKSGTNEWKGGINYSNSPNSLRPPSKDIMYANTGAAINEATDGTLYLKRSLNTTNADSTSAYVGGPIIADKLFMFLAVERNNLNTGSVGKTRLDTSSPTSGWTERLNKNDRYFAKFDWNLNEDNLVELSLIGDKYSATVVNSGFNYADNSRNGINVLTSNFTNHPDNNVGVGSSAQILKYTNFINSDLTLSALVGKSSSPHLNSYAGGADVSSNIRQVSPPGTSAYPGLTYAIPYAFGAGTTVLGSGSKDTVQSVRFDAEYKIGDHRIRAGIDDVKLDSTNAGVLYAGGGIYVYSRTSNGALRPTGMTTTVSGGNALRSGIYYYYGYEQIFSTITNAASNQSAQFIEDNWKVSKDLLVTPGLRVEQYSNYNGDGEKFLSVKNQVNPRFSFAWDMLGDSSTKVFGSAGRYGVQIPTALSVRGASRSTYTKQYFTYTGVDENGAPTGRVNLGSPYSSNNEYGQAKDANTVAAINMKPNSQDEFTVGFEKALSKQLIVGGRFTYRKAAATIDDLCDARPFENYAAVNSIDTTNWSGFGCASFNPGQANTFLIDYAGNKNYTKVNLSKADLGFDKVDRTYKALDFFAERPFSAGWYGRVNYTYSLNKGNTEGQTYSDIAQADVAATQAWDNPELMMLANGYLPNHRKHQIKAFGFYRVQPELDIGANLLVAAGRPLNCLGNFGGTPAFGSSADDFDHYYNYGSYYRYCTTNGVTSPSPRGSMGNLPWDRRLDLNLVYRPVAYKGMTVRLDVFNVWNKQTVQAINEVHEVHGDSSAIASSYGRVVSYTAPRSGKLTVSYEF